MSSFKIKNIATYYAVVIPLVSALRNNTRIYTVKELEALEQIQPYLKDSLTQDYMYENGYLLPFIEGAEFDIGKAVTMVQKNMEWRRTNEIDSILNEEIPVEREFKFRLGFLGFLGLKLFKFCMKIFLSSFEGLLTAILFKCNEIDARKFSIAGKRDLSLRAVWKITETLAIKARKINWSRIVGILDLNGFNYRQHACRECISFAQEIANDIEANYPNLAVAVFLVNTPRIFEVILKIVKGFLSERSNNILHVFAYDGSVWMQALLKYFLPEQLNQLFGHKFSAAHRPNFLSEPFPKYSGKDVSTSQSVAGQIGNKSVTVHISAGHISTILSLLLMLYHAQLSPMF